MNYGASLQMLVVILSLFYEQGAEGIFKDGLARFFYLFVHRLSGPFRSFFYLFVHRLSCPFR